MKRISLIIPVYNGEQYLRPVLESIQAQGWENLQIIFSEDGSEDGSLEILRELQKEDRRVIGCTGENLGVSAGRNRALSMADGDYIGFVDADDTLKPGYLQALADALEETGADMACCGFARYYEASGVTDGLPTGHRAKEVVDRDGMGRLLLRPDGYTTVMWNKLFRREALLDGDGNFLQFDEELHIVEDGEYIFRSNVKSAVFFPEQLYRYVVRTSGAMYGTEITPRRLTELAARQKIVEHTESFAPDVNDLAKMKYQKGVRDLMFHAVLGGQFRKVKHLLPELKTYRKELFSSPVVSKKEKLKYHVYWFIIHLHLRRIGTFLMKKFGGH